MQDGHLLHLGDLALPDSSEPEISAGHPDIGPFAQVYTGQCLLADEDRVSLHQLAPARVQEWCLSRIIEHQHHIQHLRESYGAAARDAILTIKSHIRALRSAYNDAAAINQLLLPELLIEIFSHVHPAGVINRPRVPVLRVCRYWRGLLFHTPRFWSNLLSLPSWKLSRPTQLDRFRAALSRSGSTPLSLPVRYWDAFVADILVSQTGRISSLTAGPMVRCIEKIAQLLEQDMPHLTHLAILESSLYHRDSGSTFTLDFSLHRNIRILELERTYILTPVAPYASLCHLELMYCIISTSPTSRPVRALHAVHSALEYFPNLETLSTIYSLSDDDSQGLSGPPLVEPPKAVHLPRLRLLEVWDLPAYIPAFLSHLVLPPTTALVLQPNVRRDLSPGPPAVPLFPGITSNPEPCASLSLHLKIDTHYLARWETHGADPDIVVRPVRITLRLEEVPHCAQVVAHFSRELGGVTALTAAGSIVLRGHWETVLPALPRLRSLMYEADLRATREVLDLLAGTGTGTGTPLCPDLVHLGFTWDVSPRVDMGAEDEWRRLSDGEGEGESGRENSIGLRPELSLAASLREFRDVLAERLERRGRRHGTCARIQKLWVAPRQWRFDHSDVIMEEWQTALAERCLRERLPGRLVEEIAFVKELYSTAICVFDSASGFGSAAG